MESSFAPEAIDKNLAAIQEQQWGPLDKTPVEEFLESREAVARSKLNGGTSKVEVVQLKDDGKVVFKSRDGEWNFSSMGYEKGTLYKRERAAYLVDRFLGFGLVPPTVIKEVDGEIGSAQEFKDAGTYSGSSSKERNGVPITEMGKLWLLDCIIWNTDRHGRNFLIKDKTLWAIDNGLSFRGHDDSWRGNYDDFKPLTSDTISKIRGFIEDKELQKALRGLLTGCLSQQEIDAFFARAEEVGKIIMKEGCIPKDFKIRFDPSK